MSSYVYKHISAECLRRRNLRKLLASHCLLRVSVASLHGNVARPRHTNLRIAMGEAAVAHAARFSWASSAAALAEIYDEASRIEVPDCHQRRAIGD